MKNNVQLITYVDRLTGADLGALHSVLNTELKSLFSGVHLLPFYFPIDGSDAGFDPIDHTMVDERLGAWSDVKAMGEEYEIMADLIVNHMSAQSTQFKDVLEKGSDSPYWDLFLTRESVFPNGMTDEEQTKIYRPRPGSCFSEYELNDGCKVDFWTTFTSNQLDINVNSPAGQDYLANVLNTFARNNIKMLRLDAAGYAIKKAGTNCFMLNETFDFINQLTLDANTLGMETLVEIHSYYQTQIEIAKRVDQVYDFALPPLILHSIFTQDTQALAYWLSVSPRNCITVLDTHDGIGIIDVGPMEGKCGLLTNKEIDQLVETIHLNTKGESKKATGSAASNVDLYQVNSTFYDALGKDDYNYLLARAIQFFSPGIPQVYYGGLFAQVNDMGLLAETNVGRDINRPFMVRDQLGEALEEPITKALTELIRIRNTSAAFSGTFSMTAKDDFLSMNWVQGSDKAILTANLRSRSANIALSKDLKVTDIELSALLDS